MADSNALQRQNTKKTILLVEDETLIAMSEAAILQKYGYKVITAYTAKKAIEAAATADIDLILMDIDLGKGKMGGTEAAGIILRGRDLPIVFCTSHSEREMVDKVKGITRYGYVLKNSGEFVLIESISMAFELFEANQKEKENRKRYGNIFNQASAGIAQVSTASEFLDVNETFCTITGYTKEELLRLNVSDITHPDDLQSEVQYIRKLLAGKEIPHSFEKRYIHKTGRNVWVLLELKIVGDANGRPAYMIAVVIDISDRKLAEKRMRESELKYRQLLNNAGVGIGFWTPDGTLLLFNHQAADFIGGKPEDFEGKRIDEIFKAEDAAVCSERINRTVSEQKSLRFSEDKMSLPRGDRWFASIYTCVYDDMNELIGVEIISNDITDYRESKARNKSLLQAIPDMMFILDRKGRYVDYSPGSSKILQIPPEEFIGKSVKEVLQPSIAQQIIDNMEEAFRTNKLQLFEHEMELDNKNYYFETRMVVLDENHVVSIVRDITEEKQTEEKYRALFNKLFDGIFIHELDGRIIEVNEVAGVQTGYSRKDLLSLSVFDLHPQTENTQNLPKNEILKLWKQWKTGERYVFEGEHVRKDGMVFPVQISTGPVHFDNRTVILSIVSDITERKAAHNVLIESEKKYRLIADNSNDVIAHFNGNFQPLYISPSAKRLFGYSLEDFQTKSIFDIVHPEDHQPLQQQIQQDLTEKATEALSTFRVYTKDEKIKWVEALSNYLYDKNGELESVVINERDITERKNTEEELKYKNALLSAQQEATIDGILVVDADDSIVSYNRRFIEMWRIPKDIIESGFGENALAHVVNMLPNAEAFKQKIHYLYEHPHEICRDEIELSDGKTFSRYSAPLFGENDIYYGRFWLYRDITEQKQALKEKDFLMKELNHRVKNNLVMIGSLVSLKNAAIGPAVDLSDISRQIDAVRIVHEKLYQNEEITSINIRDYIQSLLETIFSFSRRPVEINNQIRDISLHTRTVIPLGLIINEIATNAVKHGFTEGEARFTIKLGEEGGQDQYILIISNSGRPFPAEVELDNPETLGLQLVKALVQQLRGTIELQREPHPVFTIRFPAG